jgi:hypothetical protein
MKRIKINKQFSHSMHAAQNIGIKKGRRGADMQTRREGGGIYEGSDYKGEVR